MRPCRHRSVCGKSACHVIFTRQLGHASVSTTLNVYTHLLDHAEHAKTVIERLGGRFGETLQPAAPDPPADQEAVAIRRLGHLV